MALQDAQTGRGAALNIIQAAMSELWDKAKRAAAHIEQLRRENQELHTRVSELEHTLRTLEGQLTRKDEEIDVLRGHSRTSGTVDVGERLLYLSPDEREALERQINDLLTRINTHLGSDPR